MPYVKNQGKYAKSKRTKKDGKPYRKSPKQTTAMVRANALAIKKLKFNATQKAEFMVQHLASDVVEPYQYTQLLAPFAWQGIFRMDGRDSQSQAAVTVRTPSFDCKSIKINALIQVEAQTSEVPFQCTYMVCKIKKQYADQFVQNTSNGNALQEGVHYIQTPTGKINGAALYHFNTEIFDILYLTKFQLSNYSITTGATASDNTPWTGNVKDSSKTISVTLPCTTKLKSTGGFAPGGASRETSITDLSIEDIRPEDRIYTYLFNNAPGTIADPPESQKLYWAQNCIFQGRCPIMPLHLPA